MNQKIVLTRTMLSLGAGIAAFLACEPASAVNGAQLSSFGVKAAGMGGVSIALPQDTVSAANNPAGMGLLGDRYDIGSQFIDSTIDYQFGSPTNSLHSKQISPVPEGGFNHQLNARTTIGISFFGVGVGANYGRPALGVPGADSAKSSLMGLVAAPTVSYKLNEENIVSVSLSLAYERLLVQGVVKPDGQGGFAPVRTHGTSGATGYGARLGYIWKPLPNLMFGAAYASEIRMSKLSGYEDDLLAPAGGRLDVPAQYGVGASWSPIPSLTLAADWLRLDWNRTAFGSPGVFSWSGQNVFRAGLAYDIDSAWTLRTGFSRGNRPFNSEAVAANFLTAISNSKSLSAGATWRLSEKDEISASYERGMAVQQQGTGHSQGFAVSTRTTVFGLSFGRRF